MNSSTVKGALWPSSIQVIWIFHWLTRRIGWQQNVRKVQQNKAVKGLHLFPFSHHHLLAPHFLLPNSPCLRLVHHLWWDEPEPTTFIMHQSSFSGQCQVKNAILQKQVVVRRKVFFPQLFPGNRRGCTTNNSECIIAYYWLSLFRNLLFFALSEYNLFIS